MMLRRLLNSKPFWAACVLWIVCLMVGFELSCRRPLWNDEIYTQTNSIDAVSYAQILQGRLEEGNNFPLFYLLQKAVCDLTGYQFPGPWNKDWFVFEPHSQVVMRLVSNVFMSTAVALMFFALVSFYSWTAAFISLLALCSSAMFWMHWLEARPYALWFCLTTAQALMMLSVFNQRAPARKKEAALALVHFLLASTVSVGGAQVILASILYWIWVEKRLARFVWLTLLPVLISVFYYFRAPQFQYWFREGPLQLFLQNVPVDLILIICFGAAVIAVLRRDQDFRAQASVLLLKFGAYAALTMSLAWALLGFLKYNAGDGSVGFAISSRYLFFVVPVAAIMLSLTVVRAAQALSKNPWMQINFWIVFAGLMACAMMKLAIAILNAGIFVHVIR